MDRNFIFDSVNGISAYQRPTLGYLWPEEDAVALFVSYGCW